MERDDGTVEEQCPLYPGMTCRDHLNAAVDVDGARGDELVQVPFIELCPNSWLVAPDGEVERIPEKDQFEAKAVRKQVEALQEKLGRALPVKRYEAAAALVRRGDAAVEEEGWREALEAYAGIEEVEAKPPRSLAALLEKRLAAIEEEVGYLAEEILEAEEPGAEEREAARALLAAVDVAVYGEHLPVRRVLANWVRAHGE